MKKQKLMNRRHCRRYRFLCLFMLLSGPLSAQNNALWIWNTRQIIDRPEWRDSILGVTSKLDINTLFLFFPYDMSESGDTVRLYRREDLISLLTWAKEHSLSVHALAGEPEWALRRNHHRPITFAREVVKLRRETGLPDGIQFDIEPYLLLPFSLPQTKQQLIRDWINSVWKTGKLIRDSSSLVYGIAVPFWMEDTITIENITMPIGKHLSFLTDYLAVMSYRNTAEGPAGVISFSRKELEWAQHAHRKLYLGIETIRLEGSTTNYLCEVHPDTLSERIGTQFGEYADFRFRGRKLSVEIVDGTVLLGVSGGGITDEELIQLQSGLMQGFSGNEITVPPKRLAEEVRRSDKVKSVERIVLNDGASALRVMTDELNRSTMFDLTPENFISEYSILRRYAEQYPEIEGIALHHLKSVRKFLPQ